MNDILRDDMENICASGCIDWDMLNEKTVLITGATGLIGFNIVHALAYASRKLNLNMKIVSVVRDICKAEGLFPKLDELSFIVSDIENLKHIDNDIDYIIHGASPTASKYFVTNPVETIRVALAGTTNIMEIAREKNVASVVYLSSMEAYGHVSDERLLKENDLGYVNPLKPRSSYPEGKRMCEAICAAYANEYGVPAKIVRLALTFGAGAHYDDARVWGEFMRNVIEEKDIILKTKGEAKRCCLYTADAVSAILAVMLRGKAGHAYNAANPDTYCSVYEMAKMVANEISEGRIHVKFAFDSDVSMYPAPGYLNLDMSELLNLGWSPSVNLKDMYIRTIDYINSCHATI